MSYPGRTRHTFFPSSSLRECWKNHTVGIVSCASVRAFVCVWVCLCVKCVVWLDERFSSLNSDPISARRNRIGSVRQFFFRSIELKWREQLWSIGNGVWWAAINKRRFCQTPHFSSSIIRINAHLSGNNKNNEKDARTRLVRNTSAEPYERDHVWRFPCEGNRMAAVHKEACKLVLWIIFNGKWALFFGSTPKMFVVNTTMWAWSVHSMRVDGQMQCAL